MLSRDDGSYFEFVESFPKAGRGVLDRSSCLHPKGSAFDTAHWAAILAANTDFTLVDMRKMRMKDTQLHDSFFRADASMTSGTLLSCQHVDIDDDVNFVMEWLWGFLSYPIKIIYATSFIQHTRLH